MMKMKKDIIKLIILCGMTTTSLQAIAEINTLDVNKTNFFASKTDCIRASKNCLLEVNPSLPNQGSRYYKIAQHCNGRTQYIYGADLKDQLSDRKILGREFCNGVISVSTMDLPFISHESGIHNANDGLLLVNAMKSAVTDIIKDLDHMKQLAETASKTTSDRERMNLDTEFELLSININWIVEVGGTFASIRLLSGGNLHVPIHDGANRISLSLPNLTRDKDGLNIIGLSLLSQEGAKEAASKVDAAIQIASDRWEHVHAKLPDLQEAAKQDAVITTVNVTGNEFIVHKTGPAYKKG